MRMEVARKTKIAYFEVPVMCEQQVWQLQIPRHDPMGMQEVYCLQKLSQNTEIAF